MVKIYSDQGNEYKLTGWFLQELRFTKKNEYRRRAKKSEIRKIIKSRDTHVAVEFQSNEKGDNLYPTEGIHDRVNGVLTFGCQDFSAENYKKLKRWAKLK